MASTKIDIVGKLFERVLVEEELPSVGGNRVFRCTCTCGTPMRVQYGNLKSGNTKSCGCLRKEAEPNKTHGESKTPLYAVYRAMLQRCFNEKYARYKDYGGRGITVCHRWCESYENFLKDMGRPEEGMSLERLDNDKGYSKENCVWATKTTQARNTRKTRWVSYQGVRISLKAAAEICGIKDATVRSRLDHYGFTIAEALSPEFSEA